MSRSEINTKKIGNKTQETPEDDNFDSENYPTSKVEKNVLDDQDSFFSKTFFKSTFINEKWDDQLFIDGVINAIEDEVIFVNCLMDEENQIFKEKVFPKELLKHVQNLETDKYLRVKISFKAGSMRYDVYDGKGLNINREAFEANQVWDSLNDFEIDEPQ
ncbi:hypothetical protein LQ318_11315 [Aliifodinibius salicampi]|uniref:Uncharacterized protein n=1 Tax=Fodinibius salicampi TaxID=1920655 RepID=A0ABT3Q047_9BACT|nr:hypothetical protein [Fodinibius salicampi]MCW9713492.1 hypothetical protein [Fodinibius salicampi]